MSGTLSLKKTFLPFFVLSLVLFSSCTKIGLRTKSGDDSLPAQESDSPVFPLQSLKVTADTGGNKSPVTVKIGNAGKSLQRIPFVGSSITLPGHDPIAGIPSAGDQILFAMFEAPGFFSKSFILGSEGGTIGGIDWTVTTSQNIYVWGTFSGSALKLRTPVGTYFLNFANAGLDDAFILRLDSTGAPTAAVLLQSTAADQLLSAVTVDEAANKVLFIASHSAALSLNHTSGSSQVLTQLSAKTPALIELKADLSFAWSVQVEDALDDRLSFAYSPVSRRAVLVGQANKLSTYRLKDPNGTNLSNLSGPAFGDGANVVVSSFDLNNHTLEWSRVVTNPNSEVNIYIDHFVDNSFLLSNGEFIFSFGGMIDGVTPLTIDLKDHQGNILRSFLSQHFAWNNHLVKLSSTGAFSWHRRVMASYSTATWFPTIKVLSDGSLICHGYIIMGGAGNSRGAISFALNDSIENSIDKGIVGDAQEAWVAKVNANGSLAWSRLLAGADPWSSSKSVHVDDNGDVFYSGDYRAVPLEVRTGSSVLGTAPMPVGATNGFALKLNGASGALDWLLALGSQNSAHLSFTGNSANTLIGIAGASDGDATLLSQAGNLADLTMPPGALEFHLLASLQKSDGSNLNYIRAATSGTINSVSPSLSDSGKFRVGITFSGGPLTIYKPNAETLSLPNRGDNDAFVLHDVADLNNADLFSSDAEDYYWAASDSASYWLFGEGNDIQFNQSAAASPGPLYFKP